MERTVLISVLVIAALAVVGRIIINRRAKRGDIKWGKLIAIGIIAAAFFVTFFSFDPHRAWQWYEGEASLSEARYECISGRKAAADIPRFASEADTAQGNYYALVAREIEPTGYYKLKCSNDLYNQVERTEEETLSDHLAIKRKTTLFEVVRTPSDGNADKYMPVYVVSIEGGKRVLAAMEEPDAHTGLLPVGLMLPLTDRLATVAERTDSLHTSLITDYYFNLFNEPRYSSNTFNYVIYRACAALVVAIVLGIVYMIVFKRSTRKRKNIK
ncbi:MAG: hypothetical protein J6Y82_09165 [Bacteroidales bacterium]|nr:hypothetical protein [Bacteroidales bacterium]